MNPLKVGQVLRAGIKAGDRIIIANKDTLSGKNFNSNDIPRYLKGTANTDVNLQVYRKTNDSLFNVMVTRGDVNIKSVDLAYMISDHIGYIKLDRFARNSYRRVYSSFEKIDQSWDG